MDATQARDTAQEKLYAAESSARETIERNPGASMLTAFGIGLGIGIVVGATIARSTTPARQSCGSMEEFGRNVFQAAAKFVPDFR